MTVWILLFSAAGETTIREVFASEQAATDQLNLEQKMIDVGCHDLGYGHLKIEPHDVRTEADQP